MATEERIQQWYDVSLAHHHPWSPDPGMILAGNYKRPVLRVPRDNFDADASVFEVLNWFLGQHKGLPRRLAAYDVLSLRKRHQTAGVVRSGAISYLLLPTERRLEFDSIAGGPIRVDPRVPEFCMLHLNTIVK